MTEESTRVPSAKLSSTVENYLKCLYEEQQKTTGDLVGMGTLAAAMQVSPGTATAMIKSLQSNGLVHYEPRGGTSLTSDGEEEALNVLRRHRLIELFLVRVLEMDWSEVHEEAERLEHAVSDKVLARIDALLQSPTHDPHGDPIPTTSGTIEKRQLERLSSSQPGMRVRIARVMDESGHFLRFLNQHELQPGVIVEVIDNQAAADAVTLRANHDRLIAMGTKAAAKILVEPVA